MVGLALLFMLVLAGVFVYCAYDSYEHTGRWFVGAGIVMVLGVGWLMNDYYQIETRTVVVEGKDRGGEDSSYRIYTDSHTLALHDIWLPGMTRFNSADVFADVPVCHRLEVRVYGWEFGPSSMMPNIIDWEDLGEVEEEECNADNG